MNARHFCVMVLVLVALLACRDAPEDSETSGDPVLLTRDLPFIYPPALFAARVEGDVALRLFIDSLGLVVLESTSVAEPSGHPEFDSAAIAGVPFLEFQPARIGGARVGKAVVLPVKFRHRAADTTRQDTLPARR